MHLAAADAIATPIERCMVIEDSEGGIAAAKRAGAGYIVAIAPAGARLHRLTGLDGIDQVVSDFFEIDRTIF